MNYQDYQKYKTMFMNTTRGKIAKWFLPTVGVGLGVLTLTHLPAFFAFMGTLFLNGLYASVTLAALSAFVVAVMHPATRRTFAYGYMAFMDWLLKGVIRVNKIGAMEANIRFFEQKIETWRESRRTLAGDKERINQRLAQSAAAYQQAVDEAQDLKGKDDARSRRRFESAQSLALQLKAGYDSQRQMFGVVSTMLGHTDFMIEVSEDKARDLRILLDSKKREHATYGDMYRAANRMQRVGPDEFRVFDMAMDALNDETLTFAGGVQSFFDYANNIRVGVNANRASISAEFERMVQGLQDGSILSPVVQEAARKKALESGSELFGTAKEISEHVDMPIEPVPLPTRASWLEVGAPIVSVTKKG